MKFQKKLLAASISAALASTATNAVAAYNDPGTDYSNAEQSVHMWTPGMEALDSVNNILCFIDQLRTGDMVNQGVYTALVDEKKCEAGDSGDTRDKGPSQQFVVVESTRANESSPQNAKIWIPGMSGPGDGDVLVKVFTSISSEPTEADPLQDFSLKFEMFAGAEGTGDKVGEGFIKATPSSQLSDGKIGIQFFEEMDVSTPMGDEVFISAANVIKNPDGSDGVAISRSVDWHGGEGGPSDMYYGLSWNEETAENRVKIREGDDAENNSDLDGQQACLAKDQLKTAVWDYGVYAEETLQLGSTEFTAGQEISLNSGFPIVYGEDGEMHGFIGYWGIWTDDGTTPTSGVQKVDYSTNPPTKSDIDITAAPGKLWKNTLKNISLDEIAGVEFEYGVFEGGEEHFGEGEHHEGEGEHFGEGEPPMGDEHHAEGEPPMGDEHLGDGEPPLGDEHSLEGEGEPPMGEEEFKSFNVEIAESTEGGEMEGGEHGDGGHGGWTNYIIKYVSGDGENNGSFVKTHTVEHGENGPEKTALPNGEETLDLSNESMLWLWSQQLGGSVTVAIDGEGNPTDVVIAERTQVTQTDDMFGNADGNVTLNCYNRCPRSSIGTDDLNGWEGEGSPYLNDQMDTSSAHSYTINRTDMALKLDGTNVAFASGVSEDDLQGSNYQWGVNSGILVPTSVTITDLGQLHDGSIETWYEWETGVQSWNQYIIASENGSPLVFDEPLKFTLTYDHGEMGRDGADQGSNYDGQTFLLEYGGEGQLWGFPMIEAGDDHYYPAIALQDGTTITDGTNNYVVKAWHMEQKMESVDNSQCQNLALGDVPGGIPSEMNEDLTSNTDDIPDGAEELTPSVVNGVVKVDLDEES